MDWSNERYVRCYTRDTATWKLLDWQARTVLLHLFRKVDRAGVLEVGEDGLEGLAAVLELPLELVEAAIPQLTRRRSPGQQPTVIAQGGCFVLPNFIEAQETPQSDPQRKRESRARRRDLAMRAGIVADHSAGRNVPTLSQNVTDPGRNVPQPGRGVTSGHSDPDPSRSEPIQEAHPPRARAIPPSTEPAPVLAPVAAPSEALAEDPALLARRALGDEIWRELEAVRQRVAIALGVTLRPLHAMDPGRTALAMRIREAPDLETARADCLHVLRVREAEALFKSETKWLSGSLFEERGWRTALASSLAEAKRARASPSSFGPKTLRVRRDGDDVPPPLLPLREKTR